jgi:hypothetical protein
MSFLGVHESSLRISPLEVVNWRVKQLIWVVHVASAEFPSGQTARYALPLHLEEHKAHSRSAIEVGATVWYSEDEHVVKAVHTRLLVAVGAVDSYCEDEHVVKAVQLGLEGDA